jgi:TPR repeat protein
MWYGIALLIVIVIIILIIYVQKKNEKKMDELAENGDTDAQFCRGEHYLDLVWGDTDFEKAKYWFHKAAKRGHSKAEARLNVVITAIKYKADKIMRNGDGQRHFNEMNEMASNPKCCAALGTFFRDGYVWRKKDNTVYLVDGLEVDKAKAAYWFKKAADRGNAEGLYELGSCYLHGDGVEIDKACACRLLYQAAEKGRQDARQLIEETSGMSYEEFVVKYVK